MTESYSGVELGGPEPPPVPPAAGGRRPCNGSPPWFGSVAAVHCGEGEGRRGSDWSISAFSLWIFRIFRLSSFSCLVSMIHDFRSSSSMVSILTRGPARDRRSSLGISPGQRDWWVPTWVDLLTVGCWLLASLERGRPGPATCFWAPGNGNKWQQQDEISNKIRIRKLCGCV